VSHDAFANFTPALDDDAAARVLGLKNPRTLSNWRSQGRGPRFCRVGRRVVYRLKDLEQYMDAYTVDPEAT
jgi:hypothetical protein